MWFGTQAEATYTFVSADMPFEGKAVKGAPFSAQTISEHVQVLANGNRIVNTSTGAIYRDSEGRTRREQQVPAIGAFSADNGPGQMVFINDPVAGSNFILDAKNKTASKRRAMTVIMDHNAKGTVSDSPDVASTKIVAVDKDGSERTEVSIRGHASATGTEVGEVHVRTNGPKFQKDAKQESLGTQEIEGVKAEGTRTTLTIAAGAIGNEQPIDVVSERWYSPDLQMVVMSKHSDPRFGESSFKLTNINRSEPAATLFQIPADFTIKEGGPAGVRGPLMRERRRPKDQ